MSRKAKEEYHRFYSVTEHRTHDKGHTEYKVTARFVSKRRPEDVKEVEVWRRYSELKKLHGELSYTHRNLFRRQEEFPPFPRAQLFGRFEEGVIEERRRAAEDMLNFSTRIPALYNSPQLKDFFRGGEVRRPLEQSPLPSCPLPPPLIPLPEGASEGGHLSAQPQEEGVDLGTEAGESEAAREAYSDLEGSPPPTEELTDRHIDRALDGRMEGRRADDHSPALPEVGSDQSQEEFDLLFDSIGVEPAEDAPPPQCPLSDTDLALFDPCAKQEQQSDHSHSVLLAQPLEAQNPAPVGMESASSLLGLEGTGSGGGAGGGYLAQAVAEIRLAVEREGAGQYTTAIQSYQAGVDILLRGAQGDPDVSRRESVKRRTAEYIQHTETLLSLHPPSPTAH
ncbi:sorting nexin-15 [Amia ocellicauda]|uniref:sorting nexin-15 n=1 Tax=Amia ocellicauda TaxID=2972642 RepID=UPI00346462D9